MYIPNAVQCPNPGSQLARHSNVIGEQPGDLRCFLHVLLVIMAVIACFCVQGMVAELRVKGER